jgi:hypothetical protein
MTTATQKPESLTSLRRRAKAWCIKGFSRMSREQLAAAIEDAQTLDIDIDPEEIRAIIDNAWNAG